ncbi:MAG: hypothetical protein Fur0034_14730 [Desulfuromonadia bacterium]
MKRLICTAILLGIAAPLFADEGRGPNPDIGRYQIMEGQFSVTTLKGNEPSERQLFRVDTATGEVWIGKQIQYVDKKSGRIVQQRYWEPFEHYLEAVQQSAPLPPGKP